MPVEQHPKEVQFSMKIGDMLKGLVFGFVGGLLATLLLLHVGETTNEIIYGASVSMTRFYVTVVVSIACLVCEMAIGTSAREVGMDVIISWVLSLVFVEDNTFLDYTNKIQTIENMMWPVITAVLIATIFSSPIQKFGDKLFSWTPFSGKKDG